MGENHAAQTDSIASGANESVRNTARKFRQARVRSRLRRIELRGAAPRTRRGRTSSGKQHAAPVGTRIPHPHLWRIAVLWAVLFAAYSNSFEAGLVFDNDLAILQDARVHSATSSNVGRI